MILGFYEKKKKKGICWHKLLVKTKFSFQNSLNTQTFCVSAGCFMESWCLPYHPHTKINSFPYHALPEFGSSHDVSGKLRYCSNVGKEQNKKGKDMTLPLLCQKQRE